MTERQQKFIKGLRYCAKETVTCDTCPFFGSCRSLLAKTALGIINELLAQQPKWTPVTEGLPDDSQRVLVTMNTRTQRNVVDNVYWSSYEQEFGVLGTEEVIAWQPMPAAYMEREGEENEEIGTTGC